MVNRVDFVPNYPNKEILPHFYNQLNVNVHLLGFVSYCITHKTHTHTHIFTILATHSLTCVFNITLYVDFLFLQAMEKYILSTKHIRNRILAIIFAGKIRKSQLFISSALRFISIVRKNENKKQNITMSSGCARKSITRRNWDKSFNCLSIWSRIRSTDFRQSTQYYENGPYFFNTKCETLIFLIDWSSPQFFSSFAPLMLLEIGFNIYVHSSFCIDKTRCCTIKAS